MRESKSSPPFVYRFTFTSHDMSTNMYKVKPFYGSSDQVTLSNVMYKAKSFYGTDKSGNEDNSNLDVAAALELRQDAILEKLASLRQSLDQITKKYQSPVSKTDVPVKTAIKQSTGVTVASPLRNGIHDVVIRADPEHLPLSLFVLYELLKQQYSVLATSYVHSSVKNVDSRISEAIKSGSQVDRGSHQVALSVIWKQVENGPQLMISPAKQSVVAGEVNIARYINRLLSPGFDTEDVVMATNIDEWLDVAQSSVINGNSKQKTAALKNLNTKLKKSDWLVDSSFSLADIVMWSALNQSQQAKSAPENVQNWLKRCEGNPVFKTALTLL